MARGGGEEDCAGASSNLLLVGKRGSGQPSASTLCRGSFPDPVRTADASRCGPRPGASESRRLCLESRPGGTERGGMLLTMARGRSEQLTVTLLACMALAGGCHESASATGERSGPAASASNDSSRLAEMTAKYRRMGLAERMQAAVDGCYVGKGCRMLDHEARLAAADDDSEREALRASARPAFAKQYEEALRRQKQRVDSVAAVGKGSRTLQVKGPVCSRFFLENFTVRPEGDVAKRLGFTKIQCSSQAIQVNLDLTSAP